MKTFDFQLSEPIEYSSKGEVRQGSNITLYAPKANQRKKVMRLKQVFFQSIPKTEPDEKVKEQAKEEGNNEISGDAILFTVAQSGADYAEFIELGRSVICDKNAKIDDNEWLTTITIDKMELNDVEQMVGQYIANFIVKSALMSLGKS